MNETKWGGAGLHSVSGETVKAADFVHQRLHRSRRLGARSKRCTQTQADRLTPISQLLPTPHRRKEPDAIVFVEQRVAVFDDAAVDHDQMNQIGRQCKTGYQIRNGGLVPYGELEWQAGLRTGAQAGQRGEQANLNPHFSASLSAESAESSLGG